MALRMLHGEKVELLLRPAAISFAPRYAAALLPAVWGAALALLFAWPAWRTSPGGPSWQVWRALWGNEVAAQMWALAGLAAAAAVGWTMGRRRAAVALLGLAVLASAAQTFSRAPYALGLPAFVALASVPLLAWTEAARQARRYYITNLRVVCTCSFPRASETQLLHSELQDVDVRQGPVARVFDLGSLIPVPAPGHVGEVPLLRGIHPLRRVREVLELLVRRATVGTYLRGELDLDEKVGTALAALHRR